MEKLRKYINALTPPEQEAFAGRCGTTVGYLRKAISTDQRVSEGLCMRIGIESGGVVRVQDLRPDLDWVYLLSTPRPVITEPAQAGV